MYPANDHTPGGSSVMGLRLRRLGRRSYADAYALQESAARVVAGGGPDELLLVEHNAVITLGRGTTPEQLLETRQSLAAAGISVVRTDRGGGATYHGPGQLVGYPIIDLRRRQLGVRSYLRSLERALINSVRALGLEAFARPGLTGVWTAGGKVAAIGIAVRRGITRHGFALNVESDLDAFRRIVPCGLRQPVTCLRDLGWTGRREELGAGVAAALRQALGAAHPQAQASPSPAAVRSAARAWQWPEGSAARG